MPFRSFLAPTLITLASWPAHAGALLFSVKNCTAARQVLVDRTRTGTGYRIVTLGGGAGGGAGWSLAPGETLTFQADSDPGFPGLIALGLEAVDSATSPRSSELSLRLRYRTLEEACAAPGVPHPAHRFAIGEDRRLMPLREPLPGEEPAGAPAPEPSRKRMRESKGAVDQARAWKARMFYPRDERLRVVNRSPEPWTLAVESGTSMPGIRVSLPRPQLIRPAPGSGPSGPTCNYEIPAGAEFELPFVGRIGEGPGNYGTYVWHRASILDHLGRNPQGALIQFGDTAGETLSPVLLLAQGRGASAMGAPLALRGDTLEIWGRNWGDRHPSHEPDAAPPAAGVLAPGPSPSPSLPALPGGAGAGAPSIGALPPRTPAPGMPPGPPAGPAPQDGPGRTPRPLTEAEEILLGEVIGLHPPVYNPRMDAGGEYLRDALGSILIAAQSRAGSGPALGGHLLLRDNSHHTVLQPAPPGIFPRFVTMEGEGYTELYAAGTGLVIPQDGHCLIASMHFLRHGALPTADQIREYRLEVARRLPPGAEVDPPGDPSPDGVLDPLHESFDLAALLAPVPGVPSH